MCLPLLQLKSNDRAYRFNTSISLLCITLLCLVKSHLSSSFTILAVRFVDDGSGFWNLEVPISLSASHISVFSVCHSLLIAFWWCIVPFSLFLNQQRNKRKGKKNKPNYCSVRVYLRFLYKQSVAKASPFSCVFVHAVLVAANDCKVCNHQLSTVQVLQTSHLFMYYIVRLLMTNFAFVLRQ